MVQQHWGPGGQVGQFFILGHQFRWVSCHKMLWSTAGVNLRYVDLVTMLWYCKSQYVIGYRRNMCAIVRPFVWCKCTLCLSFMRLGDFDLQPPDFKMTQRRFTSTVGNLYTKLELYGMRQFVFTRTWLSQIRPSVYLSVCLSVCNVGAPYSGGWTFRRYFFTAVRVPAVYPGHPPTSVQNFTEIIPGKPSIGGVKRKRGSIIQRFWTYWLRLCLTNGTMRYSNEVQLMTNRKWHMRNLLV